MKSNRMWHSGTWLLFAGLLIVAVPAVAKRMQRVANGAWGGQGVHLDVDSNSAEIGFDCAHGTIEGPLTIDSKGQFKWKGKFYREHGGPVREGENSGAAAVYMGSIKDQTMDLRVQLEGEDEPLATYVLTQGKNGRLRKCL